MVYSNKIMRPKPGVTISGAKLLLFSQICKKSM